MLFVGAGLSAWAKLPTWAKLLETLVEEVRAEGAETEAEELHQLLALKKYLEVADCCKERLGQRFYQVLGSLRGGDVPVPEPHRLALRLPFAAWVTTNYDKLLERAYTAEHHGDQPRVLTHRDHASLGTLLFDGAPFILKAHGDIDRPDTVVLTARDYSGLIQSNAPFNAFFSALLLTKAVLFVGYSLSDPDFKLLLDHQLALFGDQVPDRWALMSGVGPVERDLLWRTARIKILPYPSGQHAEVLTFMGALEAALAPTRGGEHSPMLTLGDSGGGTPNQILIAGDDGTLYHLSGEDLTAHIMDPSHPAYAQVQKIVTEKQHGVLRPEHFEAKGSLNADYAITLFSMEAATAVSRVSPRPAPDQAPKLQPLPTNALTLKLARGSSGIGIKAVLGRGGDSPLAQGVGAPADWGAFVRALASLGATDAASRGYVESGRALSSCLPDSVLQALADLGGTELLILDLDADLETFPWELLQVDGRPLALICPLVRAPVGISEEARGYRPLRRPARALLIGDPTEYLPGARHEIQQVEALYEKALTADSTRFLGRQATAAAVLAALDATDFDIVHFAGHAWYDAQEVYLAFAGNVQVTASDLRPALSRHPPAILVLNSHFTAFVPPFVGMERPDTAALPPTLAGRPGFTSLAARTGVGALVGCFGSPGDFAAAWMAIHLHRELLGGATIAQALYNARLGLARREPEDSTELVYVLSGASELRLATE